MPTNDQIARVRRMWVEMAKGEPVTVELVRAELYGFTTELGALRIADRYRNPDKVRVRYSEGRAYWFISLDISAFCQFERDLTERNVRQ